MKNLILAYTSMYWYEVIQYILVCTGMKCEKKYIHVHTSMYCDILFIKFHTRTYAHVDHLASYEYVLV